MDQDAIYPTNLSREPEREPRPASRNPLARGARWALDWGRRNPVTVGWLGACLVLCVYVYADAVADLIARHAQDDAGQDGGDGDGGSAVTPPTPTPVDAMPAPAPDPVQSVEPDPAPTADTTAGGDPA